MRPAGRSQLVIGMILAWSVIYIIHVFVFPVYEGGGVRTSSGGSLAALEGALCGKHRIPSAPLPRAARARRRRCPPAGIATAWPGGRTGNLISEYASLWAVARRTGLEAYAPPCLLDPLSELFANLTIASLARVRHCRARWNTLVHDPREWNRSSQALVLPAYTLLPEDIIPQLSALRRELAIGPALRKQAQNLLRELMPERESTTVYVGVHVRRTDYVHYLRRTLSVAPAPVTFYLEAMARFERSIPTAMFVVVSDDPGWCREKLAKGRGRRVVVVSEYASGGDAWDDDEEGWGRANSDLAVLAACNHTIFDYGTFGLWGALLAGGDAIVYHVSGSHAAVRVAHALPGWSLIPKTPSQPLVTSSTPLRRNVN